MPWHSPLTWTIGQILTAANLNEQVRDNMQMTAPAVVVQSGDMVYATGPNALGRLGISSANKRLGVVSGLPAWVDANDILGPQAATADVTLTSTAANITGATVTLTAGKWLIFGKFNINIGSGDGNASFACHMNAPATTTGPSASFNAGIGTSAAGSREVFSVWLCSTSVGGTAAIQAQKIGGTGSSQATTASAITAVRIGAP